MLYPLVQLSYIVASILFIMGLKQMGRPKTAVRGNLLGAAGMLLAVVMTLVWIAQGGVSAQAASFWFIGAGVIIGTAVGAVLALRVQMTQMPQLVALFNGLGGAASVFVAAAELFSRSGGESKAMTSDVLLAIAASGIIGAVTFWGSLVAFGKLQEFSWMKKPFKVPMQHVVNGGLTLIVILLTVIMLQSSSIGIHITLYIFIALIASALGVLLTNPIGGADMPVVIALLNSYSGLAAAATGFVIDNNVLIIAGSLVGASGVILTKLMCKAMNRSIINVLFGVMDGGSSVGNADELYANVRSTTADDVALILETAQRVVFVPGYGMAVAQAQHAVRNLGKMLEERGTTVEYAIHPVAGRMPGHMNVLLAEADIDYDKLLEMDAINPTMDTCDVAIVIGANDVVNPVAKTDPKSPIAGMPIIDVDRARTVIVIKRSLSPGFAGIPNPLFAADNTMMLYGDGKDAVLAIAAALKDASR
ncbi:MAG: NAD(P)(+) transhydrogenase (Re/Si-specific) subunit beta [Planctomycetota bacterium]|nr:NAD(P)(+) transhydrogenase (Re/Si-specific) subunit beta [Planctomycetota bacterium]